MTPYHAIARSLSKLGPGSTTLVIGIGGLGHMAVQILAAICDTRIVAVDTRDDPLKLARDLGADHAVRAGEDAAEEILEHAKGRGVDLVLDVVGTDATLALAAQVVRPLSHLTVLGLGGGRFDFSFFSLAYEVSLATTYWGSVTELMEVLELARRGHVEARVQRFDLDGAVDAYRALRDGEIEGRAVVVP